MNEKEITMLEKKIELAKEYAEYLDKKHKESYKIGLLYDFIPRAYDVKDKIEDYEYQKDVLTKLAEKGIDVNKEYYIMDNVYLSLNVSGNISFYTYLEDDSWVYYNYISSHSGINEWLFNTVADAYDLYSGTSSLGTTTLRGRLRYIENKPENEYSDRPYTAEQIADAIEKLIKFFTDENNVIRNAIVKELEFKFNLMKELIES